MPMLDDKRAWQTLCTYTCDSHGQSRFCQEIPRHCAPKNLRESVQCDKLLFPSCLCSLLKKVGCLFHALNYIPSAVSASQCYSSCQPKHKRADSASAPSCVLQELGSVQASLEKYR